MRNPRCERRRPDFSKKVDFLYSKAGKVLFDVYDCDPYRIVAGGWGRFVREIQAKSRIHDKTLKLLWADANSSTMHIMGSLERTILSARIKELYEEWEDHLKKKEEYKSKLIALYKELEEYERLCEVASVSDYQMAKLIAETGPLRDFQSVDQIMRYAGLNLCRKASGKYVGHTKISKKGRAYLRKSLYQITFSSLIVRDGLYADYYQEAKTRLNVGMKAMVSVMRKFLKMVLGVSRSAIPFDVERVHKCQSRYLADAG